ncbi:hypothetical protein FVER53263_20912 [Fusarium verticillioides]|nr:hypothetical protein FVER53263_20912 [Fusarium verticillioides]
MGLMKIFLILFGVCLFFWMGRSRQRGGSPIGNTDDAINDICKVYSLIREETPGSTKPPSLYTIIHMDEPRKGDINVDIKAWKASIDASEEHLGTGTRREEIFIRAAGILTNYSTRSVYDGQVWNKIRGRSDALKEICGWES